MIKIINKLKDLVGDILIEDLYIPYTAVVADVKSEKKIWLNSGSLFDAIRASISLPLFFTPFNYNGIEHIDGGVLSTVPIAPTFNDNTEITIAVNLAGPATQIPKTKKKILQKKNVSFFRKQINFAIEKLEKFSMPKILTNWGILDIADKSFDAMQGTIVGLKLAVYPPDIISCIPRNAYRIYFIFFL